MGIARSRSHKDEYIQRPLHVYDVCKVLTGSPTNAPMVKSGDVLLFRGTARSSRLIEWFTWCPYSHIGIVLMYKGQLCLLESVGHVDSLQCKLHTCHKNGVRLVSLEEKLNSYLEETGRELSDATLQMCWVSLHLHDATSHAHYEQHLLKFARHSAGLEYEHSSQNLLHAALHTIPTTTTLASYTSLSSDNLRKEYQCAELVAAALCFMGVLRLNFPCADVTPKSFINGSVLDSDYVSPRAMLCQLQFHIVVNADPPTQLYIATGDTSSNDDTLY